MADVQALKDEIWYFKRDYLTPTENDFAEWTHQLDVVNGFLEKNPSDPTNLALKADIEPELVRLSTELEPLRQKLAALEAKLPKAAEPKYDPEKHPLLKKALEKSEPAQPVVFRTGDMCEALWSVDKQWYKAKILSILGAASAPKYLIKFTEYDESMTVDRDAIRLPANKRKREAEAAPPTPSVAAIVQSPHVISVPASMNPDAQRAQKETEAEVPVQKKRVIGSTKALTSRVSNWKDFTSKGPGKKVVKKDSMFRTGTSVNSRVGFTGSGAGMRETTKRVRHNNKQDAEEEEGSSADRDRDDRRSRF